jgi:ADP-heptose:LPS heptosyltransferase
MGLGDVLMVLVVIRALKQCYPHLNFRFATGRNYVKLIEGLPFLESVQPLMDLNGVHSNTVELRGLSERHPKRMVMDRIDIFALYCGVTPTDYTLPIPDTTDAERIRARELLGSGSTITVAVRGSTPIRSWPIENVTAFALRAAGAGWTVALIDNERQEFPEHPRVRNLTGELSLLDVKGILAESEFCVSPDTGILHLSEAVGTKCVGIFSVIPPELRITHYSYVKALWRRDLPCAPCWHRGCKPITCTSSITPEMVMSAIENWDMLGMATNPIEPFAVVSPSTA